MKIKDAMVHNVISVPRNASIRKLLDIFLLNRIDSLPVVDKGDVLVGYVTLDQLADVLMPRYKELIRDYTYVQDFGRLEQFFEAQSHLLDEEQLILVEDCINQQVTTVKETDSLLTAAAIMQSNNIKRLPVTDSSSRLVGIISLTDILLYLFKRKS